MPTSSLEGKGWLTPRIVGAQPATILDIGAGAGTYAHLLRPYLPRTRFTAVEIWEPYVERYRLAALYDDVITGDARTTALPQADVVILGDILEHMTHTEALALWQAARGAAELAVFASIPVVHAPQDAVNGNPHEAHRHTWTHTDGQALPGVVDSWRGVEIGCYRATPAPRPAQVAA